MYRTARAAVATPAGFLVVGLICLAGLWSLVYPYRTPDGLPGGVAVWWGALCAISFFNLWVWRQSLVAVARRQATADPEVHAFQRRQLLLSAVFVLGCAFRSVLPRADVQRLGLFDCWLSCVMVGRAVATAAELCFVAQWALVMHRLSRDAGVRTGVAISWLIVPLIAVAECFSWYAVMTTSYLGNAIEESIWAATAGLVLVGLVAVLPRCAPARRPFLAAALACGLAYVVFMCTVDVPMYVTRWLADEASGREYLSLGQGLWDLGSRWQVSYAWEVWQPEVPWMTLYFSVGVWCSLALVHTPRWELERQARPCLPSARSA